MKSKRIIAILLAAMMIVALVAGCGSKDTPSDSNSTNDATNNEANAGNNDVGGDVDTGSGEKVKLTALFSKHALTKDVNEMQWLKDLQEECNVEVEWQQITADWDQKKPAMFASGNIPDLLFSATNSADYAQYPGLFENLEPLIEQHAPNIQRMFEEHPETKTLVTELTGEIYSTPKYQRYWPGTNSTMFINKTWLDNLGLDVPTTWDELYDVLVEFKNKDANGNGDPNDEIPMDFIGWGPYHPQVLLGSLGIQLTDLALWSADGYFAEDGQVKNFFVDERYKELVKFMHELWKAGCINPDVFTQDYSQFQSLARGEDGVSKVGFTWGWDATDRFGLDVYEEYMALPQLKYSADADYDIRWNYDYYSLNYGADRIVMSAACENKEAAIKFMDGFYNPIVSMQVLFGGMNEVDNCIKDNGDGTYAVLPPGDPQMDPGTWKWTNSFADSGPMYIADDLELTLGEDMQKVNAEKSIYDDLLAKVDLKKDVYATMFIKYTQDELNTLAMNQTNINNITGPKWAEWITEGGIEEEWDAYVESVYAAGLQQNLDIRQAAFEKYLETLD